MNQYSLMIKGYSQLLDPIPTCDAKLSQVRLSSWARPWRISMMICIIRQTASSLMFDQDSRNRLAERHNVSAECLDDLGNLIYFLVRDIKEIYSGKLLFGPIVKIVFDRDLDSRMILDICIQEDGYLQKVFDRLNGPDLPGSGRVH